MIEPSLPFYLISGDQKSIEKLQNQLPLPWINIEETSIKKDKATQNLASFYIKDHQLFWRDAHGHLLRVDFMSKKLLWRYQNINKAQEPLLRAIAWKSNQSLTIWDLTAGLGKDSALLANSGCTVSMFERSPVLQVLLKYALLQVQESKLLLNLQLHCQDSTQALMALNTNQIPDVAYMDPMYPKREKSALVKQDLRILQTLVGRDEDAKHLLISSLNANIRRVVVKRPKGSGFIGDLKPHHSIQAPNTRFDVYGA